MVYRSAEDGIEVTGIRRGWEGLTHVNLNDAESRKRYILPLDRDNTRTIDRDGGTMLHTSRTNPSKMKKLPDFWPATVFRNGSRYDMSARVLENLESLGIDALIAIGGDDTLSFAHRLNQLGMKVIAVPKTMDNDVHGTEYCVGFSTAITRASDAIDRQLTTVGSHERMGIFRVFGRDAGYTPRSTRRGSLHHPLRDSGIQSEPRLIDLLTDKRRNPSNYALVILSEGAQWEGYKLQEYGEPDAYGHRKKASIAELSATRSRPEPKEETVVSDLTYDLRAPAPPISWTNSSPHDFRHDGLRGDAGRQAD